MTTRLTAWGVTGIGEIAPNDQLGDISTLAEPQVVEQIVKGHKEGR